MKIHMVFLAPQGEYILNEKKIHFLSLAFLLDVTTTN